MSSFLSFCFTLVACAITFTALSARAVPSDLIGWERVQYGGSAPSTWTVGGQPCTPFCGANGTTATQTQNSDPSFLLSDFSITHAVDVGLEITFRSDNADDDILGIVFGYQDRGSFYLFDWKRANQGIADGGMHLRLMNVPGVGDPTPTDFVSGSNTANMQILHQNNQAWVISTDYAVAVTFTIDGFELVVSQGNTVLEDWTVVDNTYTSGRFGFHNNSQAGSTYQAEVVPEPATAALVGFGLLGLAALARRP